MPLSLGVLMPKEKKKKIKIPEKIADLCKESGISITDLDVENLAGHGPFDVFFHKVTDFYTEFPKEEAENKIKKVKEFVARFPDMTVIDNFEAAEAMTDRKHQTKVLQSCELVLDNVRVFVPKVLEISSGTSLDDIKQLIQENNIKFPILAKPLIASLQEDSHTMTLIFSEDNLKDLPIPCLLQEFCNHGGVVYKVFVIGDKFFLCERPSIKNIVSSSSKTLIFDTRNVSKTGKVYIPDLHDSDPNKRKWLSCDDNPDLLNRNVVSELCKCLQSTTGLMLFGFDILVETDTGNYALIDLNHFPGYNGINENHFYKNLVDLICKAGMRNKK